MNKAIFLLITTNFLLAGEWSSSQFIITQTEITSLVNSLMSQELNEVKKITNFYENKIQKQMDNMEKNSIKLLKLQAQQNLIFQQIEKMEAKEREISVISNQTDTK